MYNNCLLGEKGMEHVSVFTNLLITGVFLSLLYLLGTYGLTLVYGVMKIINFAHTGFAILGTYIAWTLVKQQPALNPLIVLVLIILFMIIVGFITFEIFTRFTFSLGDIHIVAYYALFLVISNVLALIFGLGTHIINTAFAYRHIHLWKFEFSLLNFWVVILCLASVGIMHIFLKYSKTGRKIRAISQNEEYAKILGINPLPLRRIAWIFGVVSAGIFGVLIGLVNPFGPYSGSAYLIVVFSVTILGGMGSILGTVVASFIIGMVTSLSTFVLPSELSPIVVFVIVIAVIMLRPNGLFAK